MITKAFEKAWGTRRFDLLTPETKGGGEESQNILVTTFNPGFDGLRKIVQDNWDILGSSCATREIFDKKVLTAYRRPKNLRDLLVRAKLTPNKGNHKKRDGNTPSNPCSTRNCRYCPRLNKSGRVKCTTSKREYVSKHNVTCKSSNIVYCLTCKCCGIQYVGQTKNRLMDRFQAHFYNISHNRPRSEIGKHFNGPGHRGLEDIEIHILDFIHAHPAGNKSKYLRDLVEFNWVQRLHTNAPLGLNSMDPLSHC